MEPTSLSELIAVTTKPIAEKLEFHFQLFSQPLPNSLIPVCVLAIYLAENECDLTTELDLPAGIAFQGKRKVSAQRLIDDHKLAIFIGHAKPPVETGQFDAL